MSFVVFLLFLVSRFVEKELFEGRLIDKKKTSGLKIAGSKKQSVVTRRWKRNVGRIGPFYATEMVLDRVSGWRLLWGSIAQNRSRIIGIESSDGIP